MIGLCGGLRASRRPSRSVPQHLHALPEVKVHQSAPDRQWGIASAPCSDATLDRCNPAALLRRMRGGTESRIRTVSSPQPEMSWVPPGLNATA